MSIRKLNVLCLMLSFVFSACNFMPTDFTSLSTEAFFQKWNEKSFSHLNLKGNRSQEKSLSTVKNSLPGMGKKVIWIDADLAVGMKRIGRPGYSDVDDGFAVWQLMKSEAVKIHGISTVYGNSSVANADSLGRYMVEEFASYSIPVYRGASEPISLKKVESNPAVEAMAEALEKRKLTILAIGPATNIGILLLKYPHLADRIEEIVLVAGRRKPTDFFEIGNQGRRAPDLNFDLDNDAFRLLFQHGLSVTLCPFEISSKVWLEESDLKRLRESDAAGNRWLGKHASPWLKQWETMGAKGFNPFDVLASHYLIAPGDIVSESLNAHLEIHPNDQVSENQKEVFKAYLICDKSEGYPVKYCFDVVEKYHSKLMQTFLK